MRLIDADKLINQGYEIIVDGLQYDTCNKSIDIDNIPTAYDIDKVVEELEEIKYPKEMYFCRVSKGSCIYEDDDITCIDCVVKKAIEIVKNGCVSDDVCEWKVKSNYYVTKCSHDTDVMYGLKQNFKYCPYCGKKIKVVE